jgi:hypothetical protein
MLLLLAPSCGIGSCPDASELEEQPVRTGDYLGTTSEYEDPSVVRDASNHRLNVDRDAGTATLTFTDKDGRQIELAYKSIDSTWY